MAAMKRLDLTAVWRFVYLGDPLSYTGGVRVTLTVSHTKLMKYFRSFSATTMADLVCLCLRQALADELAVNVTYAGSADKLPFRYTRLCTLIEGERQLLNDKNETDPGNLGGSLDPVYQSVNPSSPANQKQRLGSTMILSAEPLPGPEPPAMGDAPLLVEDWRLNATWFNVTERPSMQGSALPANPPVMLHSDCKRMIMPDDPPTTRMRTPLSDFCDLDVHYEAVHEPKSSEPPTSLRLEIFGFLHTSDLSNPPVVSRHHVSNVSDDNRTPFLQLLMSALQETKTVAMCSIYAGETNSSAAGTCTKSTHADGRNDAANLLRHGFVHQVDPKVSILMLSVFPKDCIGLPWLGQFQHLAPVEDFAGVQLYDDREGSSPFPVLVPDRLSYGTLSDSNVGQNRAASAGGEPFRYVSWVSPTSLLSEVNKVLRLGRRLPEKSAIFFKELARLRSAALAYGCPELLVHVAHLTESAHATENPVGQAQSDAVRVHLDTMNRMLSEAAAQLDD
ncbi:UPF0464 protein C15orf44 [Clonorchis sinensis]|uniref:UPF0464 protein C15orf44 n=1 Tax=Clonorchis sinensis TaxID=79923 RepID=G7YFF4_CLOSI|nr:UPF0464 protein C15orf44 [Clonorchis sinensis]